MHLCYLTLDRINLSKAKFQVTGFVDFRPCISAFGHFEILQTKTFGPNIVF